MTPKNKGDDFEVYRSFGPGTYTEEKDDKGNITQRKITATIFSGDPVEVYDWDSGDMIMECLDPKGMQLPESRQLPLLDAHTRWNGSASVKGSVRNIKIEDTQGSGDIYFSSTAGDIATLAREGHLTDLSIGYKTFADKTTWVEPGDEIRCWWLKGKNKSKKRMAIRSEWKPFEVSTVPIGADARAKFRSMIDKNQSNERERNMEPKNTPDNPVQKQEPDLDSIRAAARKEAAEAERARVLEIQTSCREMNVPEEFAKDFIAQGMPAHEAIRKVIVEAQRLMKVPPQGAPDVVMTGKDEVDKFRAAAVTGLLLRSGYPAQKIDQKEKETVEKTEFRGSSIQHLARYCLEKNGVKNVRYMDNVQVAQAIISHCSTRAPAQGTGDFPYILAAAANKFLMNAYIETPTTYQAWVKMMGLDDFKQNKLTNISLFSDVDLWPEGVARRRGNLPIKWNTLPFTNTGKSTACPLRP